MLREWWEDDPEEPVAFMVANFVRPTQKMIHHPATKPNCTKVKVTGYLYLLRIDFPVFEERAEEVYQSAQYETKRTVDIDGAMACAILFRLEWLRACVEAEEGVEDDRGFAVADDEEWVGKERCCCRPLLTKSDALLYKLPAAPAAPFVLLVS
jgi:hypothetical protein